MMKNDGKQGKMEDCDSYIRKIDSLRDKLASEEYRSSNDELLNLNNELNKVKSDIMIDMIDNTSCAFIERCNSYLDELRTLEQELQSRIRVFEKPTTKEENAVQLREKSILYLEQTDYNVDEILYNLDNVVNLNEAVACQLENDLIKLDLVKENTEELALESDLIKDKIKELTQRFVQKRKNQIILIIVLVLLLGLTIWSLVRTVEGL